MITATIKIRFKGDWVDQIEGYDVFGLAIASTYKGRQTVGISALDADASEFEEVIETIRTNKYVNSLDILEEYTSDGRTHATIKTESEYPTHTPMQVMRLAGFLPIDYARYRDGFEFVEILAEDREDVAHIVSVLEYDTVEVVRILSNFSRGVGFSLLEWQQLIESVSEEEQKLLGLAIELGYADIPRKISLEELAAEAGIAKSTASNRLRNVEQAVIPMIIKHVNIFS